MAEPEEVAAELVASPEASTTSTPQNTLSVALLMGASLLAVPVGAIIHLVASVPRLVMSFSEALSPGRTIPRLPRVDVQQASEQISSRLVGSTLGGIGMTALLIAACGDKGAETTPVAGSVPARSASAAAAAAAASAPPVSVSVVRATQRDVAVQGSR